MSLIDEKVALAKIRMNNADEPKVLFNQIKVVEVRCDTKTKNISELDKMAVVLSQAPASYMSVITAETRMRRGLGIDIAMQDLQEVIDEHHRLL